MKELRIAGMWFRKHNDDFTFYVRLDSDQMHGWGDYEKVIMLDDRKCWWKGEYLHSMDRDLLEKLYAFELGE